jgi:hypothetical protein
MHLRTVSGFAVVVALSWGSTLALDRLYSLGGHPVRDEQLNPVLVQTYPSVPPDARLYATIHCPNFTSRAVLEIRDGAVSAAGRGDLKIESAFASNLSHEGSYELYLKLIRGARVCRTRARPVCCQWLCRAGVDYRPLFRRQRLPV